MCGSCGEYHKTPAKDSFFRRCFLYTVPTRQGIFEQRNFRGVEGKNHKERGEENQGEKRQAREGTTDGVVLEFFGFVKIGKRGGNEKDGNVDAVGRRTNDAVVSVK